MRLTESQLKQIIKKEIVKALKEAHELDFTDSPRAILSDLSQGKMPDEEGQKLLKQLPEPNLYTQDKNGFKITPAGLKYLKDNPA
jgi:hypothetical protein